MLFYIISWYHEQTRRREVCGQVVIRVIQYTKYMLERISSRVYSGWHYPIVNYCLNRKARHRL